MKVILLEDIETLGKKDEIKEVSGGYARNFLFPKKHAQRAHEHSIRLLETHKAHYAEKKSKEREEYIALKEELEKTTLRFKVKTGEKGKAFGSVTARQISEALNKKGLEVNKEWIMLDEPLKTTGEKNISIKLPHEITGEIHITIEPE